MLFNSLEFFVFFIIVFGLYVALSHQWQNRMLLVASYWFYAAWDWRFLSLIILSTFVDYICGQKIADGESNHDKKKYLYVSIGANLIILGFFKYFNFFASSFGQFISFFGVQPNYSTLNIILPVGISFYTFQSMSYTIDIYHQKLEPQKKFSEFALFVAFFPQLVAGPIERAKHLLPQISTPRKLSLEQFYQGCYLVLWGLFLKVFIADNLARIVNPIFALESYVYKEQILLGVYAFAFQIFCDFAGYSNIARGISKCMGFDIMNNFNLPYFVTTPSEFWKRWHISLSTWLKDYLYIPLGGNRGGKFLTLRNLMLTMLLGGLWHGAAWTFVLWGAFHGIILIIYRICEPLGRYFQAKNSKVEGVLRILKIVFFFHVICYGWLLFRAQSIDQVIVMSKLYLFGGFNFNIIEQFIMFKEFIFYVWFLIFIQMIQYWKDDLMVVYKSHWILKGLFYYFCIIMIIIYGVTDAKDFIYFQF